MYQQYGLALAFLGSQVVLVLVYILVHMTHAYAYVKERRQVPMQENVIECNRMLAWRCTQVCLTRLGKRQVEARGAK